MEYGYSSKLEYLPGLDGIRALAALLVISTHWPNNSLSLKFGWIGVNIFFVLSGFLITRILLNEKKRPFKAYLKNFFYKRALRIFPVYYLFFFVVAAIILIVYNFVPVLAKDVALQNGVKAIKYDSPYYLTYTYNIKLNLMYFFHLPDFPNGFFGHLWSLAAEEQFYLAFPFLVYFLNEKALKRLMISLLIICPLIRLWASTVAIHLVTDKFWLGELLYSNTFCQSDALAAGALLALYPIKIRFPYLNFAVATLLFLSVGLTIFYFLRQAGFFLVEGKSFGFDYPAFWLEEPTLHWLVNIRAFYQYSIVNLLAVALIAPAVAKKPLFPRIMTSTPMSHLGKISYGVYLFHNPLISFFVLGGTFFGGWYTLTKNPAINLGVFIFYMSILISLAHLSYKYFEKRIMAGYSPPK